MAIVPPPRISVAKGIIALLQQQVQLINYQQPHSSFHVNKIIKMAEATTVEDLSSVKPYHEIPGPKPLPIIGNLFRFLPYLGEYRGLDLLDIHWKLHKKYGDIVLFGGFPGKRDVVLIYKPEEIETIFRNEGDWPLRDGMQGMVYYRKITRKDFYKDDGGLMIEQGEKWMKARSKANQPLMQPRISNQYIRPISGVAQDFIDRMKMIRNEKQEMPDDFINDLFKWSLESIAYIALDKRLGCLAPNLPVDSEPQKMINAVSDFFETSFILEMGLPIWKIYPTPTWKKFVKALDVFLEVSVKYVNEAVEEVKEDNKNGNADTEPSVLERLLARSDQKSAIIMAQDMLFGGVDTTSYSMATAMYFIAKNQDKQEMLFNEIKRFLPNKSDEFTEEKIENMKYLKACLKESSRCMPIVSGNFRTTAKDIVLGNYKIPQGVWIFMPNLICVNSEEYFPMPNKFIPERWLRQRPTAETTGSAEDFDIVSKAKKHTFAFLPFGFGPRGCIGKRFADLEMEILLAKLVRNFHIEYNYGDLTFDSKILNMPREPLRFKISERKS